MTLGMRALRGRRQGAAAPDPLAARSRIQLRRPRLCGATGCGRLHAYSNKRRDVTKSASATIAVTDLPGVLTYHNNLLRDGSNIKEYALTTALVTTTTFGKLFSCQADGAIYTQPLWVPRVTISGMPHNVIVVATQHNSVYAFDADASPCTTLWHTNLLDSAHGGTANETSVPSGATGGSLATGSATYSRGGCDWHAVIDRARIPSTSSASP